MHRHDPTATRSRRHVLRWVLASAGVLLLLVVGGWMVSGRRAARHTARLLAESSERGEPMTYSELAEYYSLPSEEQDVAQLWLAAIAPFDTEQFADRAEDLPIIGAADATIPPPGQPWPGREAVEKLLQHYQPQLAQMHEAAAAGGAARYPVDFSPDGDDTTHWRPLQNGAGMLQLEAHLAAHRGDTASVTESLIASLRAGESLEYEPRLLSQLLRGAICESTARTMSELLPHLQLPDSDMQRLMDELGTIDLRSGFYRALAGERAVGSLIIRDSDRLGLPWHFKLTRRGDYVEYLSWTGRFLQAARLPMPDALDELETIESEMEAAMQTKFARLRWPLTSMVSPFYQVSLAATARHMAARDMGATAIAVERYRRHRGQLPNSLDELVPLFLPAVPVDPFDGQPLRYMLDGSTVVLYTISENRVDDGGDEQADCVVRLEY